MRSCRSWPGLEVISLFAKLAFRNVRRQVGNYLIYFMTVAMTVALIFAVNNILYNPQLAKMAKEWADMRRMLMVLIVFISMIVVFVLGYATAFMLRLRKREFGTYLTLGMTRRNLLAIFFNETMIMCLLALAVGIFMGLFIYQGLMLFLSRLMDMSFEFAAYSGRGLVLTVLLVGVVFVLSSLTSAIYLKRVSVYQLLHGGRTVEKKVKRPWLYMLLTVLSLIAMILCCVMTRQAMLDSVMQVQTALGPVFMWMACLGVSMIIFHFSLAKSVVNLLLKSRRFCSRGTNTFLMRQLSAQLSPNALMAGFLACLLLFAVIGANASFFMKVNVRVALDRDYPFDIDATLWMDQDHPVDIDKAMEIIGDYGDVAREIRYNIYDTQSNAIYNMTPWGSGFDYGYDELNDAAAMQLTDPVIAQSDMNRLLDYFGMEPISLGDEYVVITDMVQISDQDFSGVPLKINGKVYKNAGIISNIPRCFDDYFVAVVPDAAVEGLPVQFKCVGIDLVQEDYDWQALRRELSYELAPEDIPYPGENMRCDYIFREEGRASTNSNMALLVIGALYMAIIFVFMSMAMLALKTLSTVSEDRQRYDLLYRLGAGLRAERRTLFRQILIFFLLPFVVPALMSIPTAMACADMMGRLGFESIAGEMIFNALGIMFILTAIYLLYFAATYMIARRNIIVRRR